MNRQKPLSVPSCATAPLPLAAGAVALTILSWASAFPLIHLGLQAFEPLPLAAARFAIASALVLFWLMWQRPAIPSAGDAVLFLLCGFIGISLYNALLNTGQQTVTAGAASFIVNTVPILTAVMATVFLRERFNAWGWLGTAVSFGGVGLIASGQAGGLTFGAGTSLVFAAAVCQATYFVVQRPLVSRYGALACTAYTLLAGAVLLLPWLSSALTTLASPGVSAAVIGVVIALGVFPAALGYATWTYALGYFGAARASNFLYLVPPLAVGLAFLLTGEVPGATTLFGGGIALAGVVLVNTRGRA